MSTDTSKTVPAAPAATETSTAVAPTTQTPAPDTPVHWTAPVLDLLQGADAYVIVADLPGVSTESLSLDLDSGRLTISGRRSGSDQGYRRSLRLPKDVDPAQIHAQLEDGVLMVEMPKSAAAQARRIPVRRG